MKTSHLRESQRLYQRVTQPQKPGIYENWKDAAPILVFLAGFTTLVIAGIIAYAKHRQL